jgi:hypothetical protein
MFLYANMLDDIEACENLAAGDGFETFLLTYSGSLKYYKQTCEISKR